MIAGDVRGTNLEEGFVVPEELTAKQLLTLQNQERLVQLLRFSLLGLDDFRTESEAHKVRSALKIISILAESNPKLLLKYGTQKNGKTVILISDILDEKNYRDFLDIKIPGNNITLKDIIELSIKALNPVRPANTSALKELFPFGLSELRSMNQQAKDDEDEEKNLRNLTLQ